MNPFSTKFEYASDQSLMVYLGDSVTLETHHRVLKLIHLIQSDPLPYIRNLHPAYSSVLFVFDPVQQNHQGLERLLRRYIDRLDSLPLPEASVVDIPVCYGGELGPDLKELAMIHNLSIERVIELHSSAEYTVYFMGFVPGFAYLGGMPLPLATPRLSSPRLAVPVGSVAIGGEHTGVYPSSTPGGWRLIGRTPLALVDPSLQKLSPLAIGDKVRFCPITEDEYAAYYRQPELQEQSK